MLVKLKKAGCRAINYGMESGVDDVLKLMNKKTTSSQNESAIIRTKNAGILCQTTWIAGFPGETPEQWEETVAFVRRLLPNTFGFYDCLPYPNTPIYTNASEGEIVGDWSIQYDDIYFKDQMRPEIRSFRDKIAKDQRKILVSIPFLWQTFLYLIRRPNAKLFVYGLNVFIGRIRRLSALKQVDGGKNIY